MISVKRIAGGLFLASGVLMGLTIGAPTARAAGDARCADVPEACATVVVTITGYGSGDAQSGTSSGGADGLINCHHALNATSGSCRYDYYIAGTGRLVYVSAAGTYPDEVTPCLQGASCSGSQVIVGRNIARGGRYTLAFTLDVRDPSTVTVHKSGGGAGRVESVNRDGINCGASCSWPFYLYVQLELRATPSAGSTFVGWDTGGRCAGQGATCTVQPQTTSVSVTAIFALEATEPPVTVPPASPKPSPSPQSSSTPKPSSTPAPTAAPSRSPTPSMTASAAPPASTGPASPTPAGTASAPTGPSGTTGPGASTSLPQDSSDPAATSAATSAGPGEAEASPSGSQANGPVAVVVSGSPPPTAGAPAVVTSSAPRSDASAAGDGHSGMWSWLLLAGLVVAIAVGIRIAYRKGVRS